MRAAVEHVFARQKGPVALIVSTISLARVTVNIEFAILVYNTRRAVWLVRQTLEPA